MGKTYLALGLGIAVASGGPALGQIEVEQGDVLGLFLEDGPRRLRDRLRSMLDGRPAPERLTLATEWPRINNGGLKLIEKWIERSKNPRLIICDTLKRIRSLETGRRRLYDTDYEAAAPLNDLAHKYDGIGILINHHTRKADSEDHIDLASGSLDLTGAVDAVLTMRRARGEADATLYVSGRDTEDKEIALRWDEELEQWNLLGDASEYQRSTQRRAVLDLLRHSVPLTPKEISHRLSRKHSATKKLLWMMARDGDLRADDGRYGLPSNLGNPVTPDTVATPKGYSVTPVTAPLNGQSIGKIVITQKEEAQLRAKGFTDGQIYCMKPEEAAGILMDDATFYAELQNDPAAWSEFEARVLKPSNGDGTLKDVLIVLDEHAE